jgi:hypothetical protein
MISHALLFAAAFGVINEMCAKTLHTHFSRSAALMMR